MSAWSLCVGLVFVPWTLSTHAETRARTTHACPPARTRARMYKRTYRCTPRPTSRHTRAFRHPQFEQVWVKTNAYSHIRRHACLTRPRDLGRWAIQSFISVVSLGLVYERQGCPRIARAQLGYRRLVWIRRTNRWYVVRREATATRADYVGSCWQRGAILMSSRVQPISFQNIDRYAVDRERSLLTYSLLFRTLRWVSHLLGCLDRSGSARSVFPFYH